jgi:hypothetical protein
MEVLQQTKSTRAAAAKHGIAEAASQPCIQPSQQHRQVDNQGLQSIDQQQQRLDMASVLSTVRDWVVASQCLLVMLEQTVAGTVLVLLPVVMHTPTWLVGVVYVAMVSRVAACRASSCNKPM